MPGSICDLVPPLWPASPLLRPTRGQLGAHRQAPAPVGVAVAPCPATSLEQRQRRRQCKRGACRRCRSWHASKTQRRPPPGVAMVPTTLTTTALWGPALLMMTTRQGSKGPVQVMRSS